MEDYAAKMQLKTEAALREYVTGHAQYREDAVLAAFDELRRRGLPAPEEAALRPGLETVVAAQRQAEAAAEAEAARLRPVPDPSSPEATGPALFSTGTISVFTILFPIFGGALLMAANLVQLRRWRGLALLGAFVLGYVLACGLLLMALLGLSQSPVLLMLVPLLLAVPAIAAYVGWFWPRYVGTQPYRSRGWLVPLLIGLLLQVGLKAGSKYVVDHQPAEVRQELERMIPKQE
jgi:hypothetical protein